MTDHLKRFFAPKTWKIKRKGIKFVSKPSAGPHRREMSMPINVILRDLMGYAKTTREVKYLLNNKDVLVDAEGNIAVDGKKVGTIKIVAFPQSNALKKVGNTLFAPVDPQVTENAAEGVKVNQGSIELSNVDGLRVMTEMIQVLRAYESYKKVIQSVDSATAKAINDVGSVK